MEVVLTETELRVIGALIEKQMATPEYYPLTLNALINACNQTSNRDPVMTLDETIVVRTLDGLRERDLLHTVRGSDARGKLAAATLYVLLTASRCPLGLQKTIALAAAGECVKSGRLCRIDVRLQCAPAP